MNAALGQHFTPASIVERMIALRRNHGSVLEPAAGAGAFLRCLEQDATGIEIDPALATDVRTVVGDFFDFPVSRKFDTIIGNPPYVRYQDISRATSSKLPTRMFNRRTNLYLFFIAKCVDHLEPNGELILITPRYFLKATAAKRLNELLYRQGSMSHYYELGDDHVFARVTPNCAIWRWQEGLQLRKMETGGTFRCREGQILFKDTASSRLGERFDVKVGAVSGADAAFVSEEFGDTQMVCSKTRRDGRLRPVIYNRWHWSLVRHKQRLLGRRIRQFDESNWWQWGRNYCNRPGPRIYVNGRTRCKQPFFVSETEAYDGSVLALMPRGDVDLDRAVAALNGTDWERLGFVCDGRFLFTQKSLENAPVDLS
ncbi:MAG: class I SAM-dependent methyltransferase [Pseudomonadales bacterium]|nr:class I SAM-dependent methyltransferase [Pseudomonadales bacterium]